MSNESKAEKIERVKANLPLPEEPPVAPDWQSADSRTTAVGSGRISGDVSKGEGASAGLREPASTDTTNVDFSKVGREDAQYVGKGQKDSSS
ncbi:hypothetical protein QR685DRAFT_467716 [Neurospora intermedia]|uniref:Tubulin gamma chain n=1 Tax=Neurospora intermedia TaxID=5142 RepID=A0ABR3DU54_NEUIN